MATVHQNGTSFLWLGPLLTLHVIRHEKWSFSKTLFKPEEFENPSLEFYRGWKTVWKWKFLESMKS